MESRPNRFMEGSLSAKLEYALELTAAGALTGAVLAPPIAALVLLLAAVPTMPLQPIAGDGGDAWEAPVVTLPEDLLDDDKPADGADEPNMAATEPPPEPHVPPPVLASTNPNAVKMLRPLPPKAEAVERAEQTMRARLRRLSDRKRVKANRSRKARRVNKKRRRGRRCKTSPEISELADNRYEVTASWVKENSTMKAVGKSAWLDWHDNGKGKRDGFELKRVRCGPLWQIGLRSGDVVHTINGRKVKTITKAFVVYTSLRRKAVKRQQSFRVKITRDGEPVTLHYDVVDA